MATRSSRSRGAQQPTPTWVPVVVAVTSTCAGLAAVYFGFPGMFLVWLGLTVGAWTSVPPEITGRDPQTKNPIPQGPREQAQYQRYQFWRSLKWNLLFPFGSVAPGWPVRASFLGGLLAAAVAYCLPHYALPDQYPTYLLPALDAVFAFVVVTQVAAARRDTVVANDRSPGVRIDSLPKIGSTLRTRLALFGGAVAAAAVGGFAAGTFLPAPVLPHLPAAIDTYAWYALGALVGFSAVVARPWVDTALEHWRLVCAAREEWAPRWTMLKHNFPPRLSDRRIVGQATVDSFTADGAMGGSGTYLALGPKIVPTMGRPVHLATLPSPTRDSSGQEMPGTIDPNDFQIVTWPSDFQINLADPSLDPDVAKLWLSCSLAWVCEGLYEPPMVDEMTPLGAPSVPEPVYLIDEETGEPCLDPETGEPMLDPEAPTEPTPPAVQAYAVTLFTPRGPSFVSIRKDLIGSLAARCGCEALADHRAQVLYLGALTEGPPDLEPEAGITHEALRNLATEDDWNAKWAAILKQDVNPPTIDHRTYAEHQIVGGGTIRRQAFIPRQGVDLRDFFALEPKIAATFSGAPFVSVTGWTTAGRVGERHAQAFSVHWSTDVLPANPDMLRPMVAPERPGPGRGRPGPRPANPRDRRPGGGPGEMPAHNDGYLWLLSGRMNQAFKAARLAQPEAYEVRCLTQPRSQGHIWAIKLRLYDGVTLADVRGASQRLRQSLGSEWLRVEAAKDGCTIVVGANPKRVRLATPATDEQYIASLDWEQAFLDAKVSGVGGLTPKHISVDHLPKNDKVEVHLFELPSGLSLPEIKEKTKKLETSTANAFVEARRSPSGRADEVEILACEVHPLPEKAPFDWEEADSPSHRLPFATNITGEATSYDNAADPHLLISGQAGGGKSVALQNIIYGAVIRNWDLYVIDPAKGAVDFNFAEPYAVAVGRTVWEAKGIIEAIYAEVVRRKAINSQYNCGNYRDLPDDVRYPHVLVVMDEFTSLMLPEPASRPTSDDPEVLAEHAKTVAMNAARAYIGTFVGKIVREARSTGFTMLMATQALKSDTLSKIPGANDLKDNMSRMIVGRASNGQLMSALKMPFEAPPQPDVLPPGRGLYEGNGRPSEVVQVWFEGSQETFARKIAERRQPVDPSTRLDLSSFVEPEAEVDGGIIDGHVLDAAPRHEQVFAPSLDDLDQVVEVDSMSLSLDDLEAALNDDDLEPAVPTAPSAAAPDGEPVFDWDAAQAAALAEETDADSADEDLPWPGAFTLDVVDPASPSADRADPSTRQPDPDEHASVAVTDSIVWDDVDPSGWEPDVSEYGWTEIDAVVAFLADFPRVRTVTWTDPRLWGPDSIGIPFIDTVRDLFEERHVTLVGPPEPAPATPEPAPEPSPSPTAATPSQSAPAARAPGPVAAHPPSSPQEALDEFDSVPRVPAHLLPRDNPFD